MTEAPVTIGRYHVVRLIAHGGMGSLYLARDPAIDRLIAIKLLREGFEDESLRERFAREARATGRLRHPNIVTVFDIGEHEKRPFIAMEYVPGETLAQLIRRRASLTIVEKLVILEDLCAALDYAHAAGIVHRDIKPANVMLEDVSGTLKVLDFGIAHAGESGLTNAGEMVGTLNYMSPEQITGDPVDHRTDVYAVGALAYELLSYQRAFPGTLQDGALFRILNNGPEPLDTIAADLDPEIARIVQTALARDPNDRHQNMERLRLDLANARSRLVEQGAVGEVVPPVPFDSDSETMVAPAEGSGAGRPRTAPPGSLHGRPLSGARASSSIRRGTSPSAARPEAPAPAGHRLPVVGIVLSLVAVAALAIVAAVGFRSWRTPAGTPERTAVDAPLTPPSPPMSKGPAPEPESNPGQKKKDEAAGSVASSQAAEGRRQRAPDTANARERGREGALPNPPAAVSPPSVPPQTETVKAESVPPSERDRPVAPPAPPATVTPDKPLPMPPVSKPDAPAVSPAEPAAEAPASQIAAIRDALQRYARAYESRDSAAVAKVMPSLSQQQLRTLDRDFSNFRTYTVAIRNERVTAGESTATVACEVVRSFVTTSGVAGGNTVPTVFDLRKAGGVWVIAKVESR